MRIVKLDNESYEILYRVKCVLRERNYDNPTFSDTVRALAGEVIGTTLYNHPLLREGKKSALL